MRKSKEQTITIHASDKNVIVVAPDEAKQMEVERNLRSTLPRCERATALLRDFGIQPSTAILHECVTMSEDWEQKEDLTPTYHSPNELSKWTHTMSTRAVFYGCPILDAKLGAMLKSRTDGMTPKETREYSEKFYYECVALKESLAKCFKSSSNEEEIKKVVLNYVETDKEGNVKAVDNAQERIKFDTAIKVDTPESAASYNAHVEATRALNAFIDTLINADRLNVVSDLQQLFDINPDTLKLSPCVIDYKLFSER